MGLEAEARSNKEKIKDLEGTVGELEDTISHKQDEIQVLMQKSNHSNDNMESMTRKYELLLKETQSQRNEFLLQFTTIQEKSKSLKQDIISKNNEYNQLEKVYQSTVNMVKDLKNDNLQLKQSLDHAKIQVKDLQSHISRVETSNKELNLMNYELVDLRQVVEDQKTRIDILEWENNQLNVSLEDTKSRLGKYEEGVDPKISFSKSILSEIDEKRVKAEQEANDISQKHQGLLKAHTLTVRQKERMKNHISRLTQLSQKQSAEHRVEILEAELSQALSENQDLEQKLLYFSKNPRSRASSDGISDDDEKTLISKLLMDNNKLNQEIKTLHMLKLNEADKVRTAYSLLHNKEQELDQIRTQFAQTKFDLDEALLKLQNPDAFKFEESQECLQDKLKKPIDSDENEQIDVISDKEVVSVSSMEKIGSESLQESVSVSEDSSIDTEAIENALSSVSTSLSSCGFAKDDLSETDLSDSEDMIPSSRNIKLDRAKIGQECNQQ